MSPEELRTVMEQRGHVCRVKKEEVQVQTCVFCGNDRYNLELNAPAGVYKCWACKEGGILENFLKRWFDLDVHIPVQERGGKSRKVFVPSTSVPRTPLLEIPSALRYLKQRGLDPLLLQRYGVGVCAEKGHRFYARLVIPVVTYWTQADGGVVGRDYIGKVPKYLADTTVDLVGWRVRDRKALHLLLEGPFDGITAHLAGFNAALLLGRGEEDKAQMWAAQVPADAPLGILLDGDAEAEAQQMWWMLQTIRPDIHLFTLPPHLDPAAVPPSLLRKFVLSNMAKDAAPT